ncbi:MAG: IS1595 family transposase [Bacteroidales bacterium]
MTKIEQIIELFNSLSFDEQRLLMAEFNKDDTDQQHTANNNFPTMTNCPYCQSKLIIKHGVRDGVQRYKCKSCHKVFTSATGTSYYYLHKKDKFGEYKALMEQGYIPIKKIAAKIGISIQTAFDWRHKILSNLKETGNQFEGLTEIDDLWFLYSQKGRKGLKYSRKHGGSKRRGDNNFQVKLLITADRKTNKDLSVVRIGRLKKSDIERKVGGQFVRGSTLISDKHRSISSFAKAEGLTHVSFLSKKHTAGGDYHIQKVNNIATRLKTIVNHQLRGVSTKYLQCYANWFAFLERNKNHVDCNNNLDQALTNNNQTWNQYTNMEDIYKRFIENLSARTYRCPIKRKWKTQINYTSNNYDGSFI